MNVTPANFGDALVKTADGGYQSWVDEECEGASSPWTGWTRGRRDVIDPTRSNWQSDTGGRDQKGVQGWDGPMQTYVVLLFGSHKVAWRFSSRRGLGDMPLQANCDTASLPIEPRINAMSFVLDPLMIRVCSIEAQHH
ncbi:uncharacterized protein MCYG_04414 [Microsporum canis CBS 113480]|uniref:Uncharacterized protein n=1 Tax=Arthroderma otae (strain ATCC MYA-4605 / CBS 113480) TaxID=554155 RepID=C5FNI1_ARTOC|nr:uncharacterized protein MCYG_04414 [Microsporum canis CBS 113480]EEQ31595.1 predicted protein [Microsporum canis CBS 113480]